MTMIPKGLMRANSELDFGCAINDAYQEILRLHDMLTMLRVPCELRQIFDGWELCYPSIEDCMMSVSQFYPIYRAHGDLVELLDHHDHTKVGDAQKIAEIILKYHRIERIYDERSVYVEN